MNNPRFYLPVLILTLIAAAVFVIFLPFPWRWISLSVLLLPMGFILGRMWLPRGTSSDAAAPDDSDPAQVDFTFELLSATVNEMREGVLVIDSEMRVVASNRAAGQLFLPSESLINSRRLTELTRNPAVYDAFLDGVRGTERSGVRVEIHAPTRRVFDLRVIPLRVSTRGVEGAVGVFFDVTRLERLENVRQEFLSNVSHELRTPLTAIVALSETLETGAIDDADNNRRFLGMIQKNAARMHRLIDDILELSAIEAGNVTVRPESVPLRGLIEDVIGSLANLAAAKKVSLRNLVAPQTEVVADPHRMTQMLTNLIENAIKFNRDGGSVSVTHECNGRDRIAVADTGEGIPSHHLDRLFERFYRVDRARSRELGGTGLGLAIVKHLARSHGGEVTVSSTLGEGTEFVIELPATHPLSERDQISPA
jgi:two-component system, OmpR family, phosphate regulon sensor histidine kinase PhoR